MKIASKISISFLITATIITCVAVFIVYTVAKDNLKKAISDHLITAAKSRANHIETLLNIHKELVEFLSSGPLMRGLLGTSKKDSEYDRKLMRVNRRLDNVLFSHKDIFRVSLLDKNGKVISSTNEASVGSNKNADQVYLQAKESTYIGDLRISAASGVPTIVIAAPVFLDHEFSGVIIVDLYAKKLFWVTLDTTGLGETGEIYLVNNNAYMISPSRFNDNVILKQKVETPNAKNCLKHKGKEAAAELGDIAVFPNYRGVNVLGTHVYLPLMECGLLAEIDEKEALAPLDRMRVLFAIVLFFVPIVAWMIGIFASRIISRPIHKLREGTEVIGKGNLGHRVSIDSRDEIGQLSMAFDKMTEDLRKTTTSMGELNREIAQRKHVQEALRKSEDKYRTLFADSRDAIYISSREGRFTDVNQSALHLFGYSMEEMIGSDVRKIYVNPDDRGTLQQQIELHGSVRDYEMRFCKKDGAELDCLLTATLRRADDGTILGYQGIIRDVTERKRLQAQLQQAQKMEALGTLAGGIAHDFNNLLMGIQGNVSLMLSDTDTTHPHYERLKTIEKGVQSGARLTSHLLGCAREGKYEVKPVDLNHLVRETSDSFGRARKDVSIYRQLTGGLFTVEADPGQIEQVLWNLLVNAADAMPNGGDLILKTDNVTQEDMKDKQYDPMPVDYVRLTVTDTGVGMSKKTIDRIFDPFFTTKEMGRGTGLGLASAYGIIKAHAGYIDVESEEGLGTTFNIYLPSSDKEIQKVVEAAQEVIEGTGTILLIDDEEVILEVGHELLEAMGYRVLIARDGREAVEIYKDNKDRIDLVILDIIMPRTGGGEAYDRMKEINPNIKVLLSSGYSMDSQAKEILARGCDAFIQKPFGMQELSQKIREVLEKE